MQDERDNLLAFPVPSTRLLRLLVAEAVDQPTTERIALRLIRHVETTDSGRRCPWCRLPPPAQDA